MVEIVTLLSKLLEIDLRRALCTILLLFFLMAAYIQSYAFVDDVPGVNKPPLYDLLRPFDFWAPAMLLIMPMALLTLPLQWLGFSPLSSPLVWPLQAIYLYFLSCLLAFGHDRWGAKWRKGWRWLIWLLPFLIVAVLWMPGMLAGMSAFWNALPFFISSILFTGCVLSLYIYIAACFGVGVYKKLRAHP
ncbi:MAG: hypothetical protein H5T68_04350 [Chloroflexi bacterium]|nr:hypothetical protein [Chloroflexota bacterium]